MNKRFLLSSVAAAVALALAGCGGGGASSSSSSSGLTNSSGETLSAVTTGFSLPSEISAVPANTTNVAASMRGLNSALRSFSRAAGALSATTDYGKAQTKKFVEERALEQFEIVEEVLSAVGQTNYALPANVNAGPYTAMVAWTDDEDGREIKTLEPWVVDSRMIVINGVDVNRVLAWIEEPDRDNPGGTQLVKAEFLITQAATVNADGSFADYGIWDLNVSFNDSENNYFAAKSTIDGGVNTIEVHEKGMGEGDSEMKGILVRSGTSGYGKVSYPDWESCWTGGDNSCGPGSPPPVKEAQYAYNAAYLAVDADINDDGLGANAVAFKDRDPDNAVEMTHRYGLFYDENTTAAGVTAGDDVEKHTSFGFPVSFTAGGYNEHAYYGAWQGRHELWGGDPETGIAAGTVVSRDDRGPNSAAVSYVVSEKFNGTLTKRTLVDGSLADIQNIPVETFINKNYDLRWDQASTAWKFCEGYSDWDFNTNPPTPTCRDFADDTVKVVSDFTDFDSLIVAPGDRKHVNVGRWDNTNSVNINYLYGNPAGGSGAGFYEAEEVQGNHGPQIQLKDPLQLYTPTDGDNLYVNVGGSIYIEFDGTSWVQKTLTNFDQQTWTPTFDPAGDIAFEPELGGEYYINNQGASFVVKRKNDTGTAADDYDVFTELQSAANPVNAASFLPAATSYLATPWQPELRYELETNAADSNYMKLVYITDDPNTQDVDESTTITVVTNGQWGLQPFNVSNQPLDVDNAVVTVDGYGIPSGATRPVEFNWEYSEGGWGTQQFLCTTDCSVAANYEILDNPIALDPVTIGSKTLSLQFDGWMHGLPDMYHELAKNNWQMTADLSSKVINIPAGTAVSDGTNDYYIKPLEISMFLAVVPNNTAGVPDITSAAGVDLSTVPTFTDHGMGVKPAGTVVKYSEGKAVE